MKPKTLQARIARLMPGGVPRYVRCYALPEDSGSFDRFTVVFTGRAASASNGGDYPYVGLSGHGSTKGRACDVRPGSWGGAPMGRSNHLGKRVPFSEMPESLRRVALEDYREIWRLNPEGVA